MAISKTGDACFICSDDHYITVLNIKKVTPHVIHILGEKVTKMFLKSRHTIQVILHFMADLLFNR